MSDDEDQLAATALGDALTSAMFRAYEIDNRKQLFSWERDGYRWLIRFKKRRPDGVICAWSSSFMQLNHDAIMGDSGEPMDFNLRAARLARQANETQ